MAPENRQTPRIPVTQVKVNISSPERLKSSYLKDLSEGGVFIRADKPLPVGRKIVVDLLPPGWVAPMRLNGVVQRVQTGSVPGMGVRFEENSPTVVAQLKALITEYSSGEPALPAADGDAQLQQLLGSYADLQTSLQQRTEELEAERLKRVQAQERNAELAAAVDSARSGNSSASDTLKVELEVALAELNEARTAVLERDGQLEAYKREVQQLESDEATSRRLATKVAREKADLHTELAALKTSRSDAEVTVKRLTSEQQVLRAEAKGNEIQHRALVEDVARLQAENNTLTNRVSDLTLRLSATEKKNTDLVTTTSRLESQLILSKGDVAAKDRRISSLDAALKEANDRATALKVKERELRDLLAMVGQGSAARELEAPGASGNSVIISTPELDGPAEPVNTPELEGPATDTVAPSSPAEDAPPPPEPAAEPPPPPEHASEPEPWTDLEHAFWDSTQGAIREPPENKSPAASDSFVGIDVDVSEDAPPAPPPPPLRNREDLEQRLRQNEPLVRTPTFDSEASPDEPTRLVKGLLEAGTRLSELMVLGRGSISPPELLRVLVTMLEQGAITFQSDPPTVR